MHADVGHRKNLLLPQLAAVGDPDERDARRHVAALLLRLVGGDDGVGPGGPLEVDDAVELERFLSSRPIDGSSYTDTTPRPRRATYLSSPPPAHLKSGQPGPPPGAADVPTAHSSAGPSNVRSRAPVATSNTCTVAIARSRGPDGSVAEYETRNFSPGEKSMRCTPGCAYRWMRANDSPPHTAIPWRCTVARNVPRGDQRTKASDQNERAYAFSHDKRGASCQ